MPEGINEKPFLPISFGLLANGRQQFETASARVVYVAEGSGITPGGISLQFDDNEPFRVKVGDYIRVKRFDKIRVWNNLGVAVNGVLHISADPDFLFINYDRGF